MSFVGAFLTCQKDAIQNSKDYPQRCAEATHADSYPKVAKLSQNSSVPAC